MRSTALEAHDARLAKSVYTYVQHLVLTAPARGRRSEIRDVNTDRWSDKSDRDPCVLSIRLVYRRPLLMKYSRQPWSYDFGGLAVQGEQMSW